MKKGTAQKQSIGAVLIVLLIIGLSGCTTQAPPLPESSIAKIQESIDLTDYTALTEEYLTPIAYSGITASSWDSADKIPSHRLTSFYATKKKMTTPTDTRIEEHAPIDAKEVEDLVLGYFDVPTQRLRQSEIYNASRSTYTFCDIGDVGAYKVVSAQLEGQKLLLDYEYYSPTDDITVIREGVLTVLLEEDSYKYVACQTKAVEDKTNPSQEPALSKSVITKIQESIDLTDYAALTKGYLSPVVYSAITAISWDSAYEISPHRLTSFYAMKKRFENPDSDIVWEHTPIGAKEVEELVLGYFDVPPEYLRQSRYYDGSNSTYTFGGIGDAGAYKVISAQFEGQKLLLSYEYYSRADDTTVIREGVLTVLLEENSYKYVACVTKAVD